MSAEPVRFDVGFRSWFCTLFAPSPCIFCDRVVTRFHDGSVCRGCWQKIKPMRADCLRCGQQYGGGMCVSCAQCADLISLDVARSYGKYGGELGALLRHYKYRGDRSLAYGVARLMGQTLANDWHCSEWDAVVAVPMHPARIRERGFDHMELVGRLLAKQVGLPFSKVLSKRLASRPQAGLAEKQRRRNVRRTFALRGPVSARRILLLDDIFTTGATANECARILKKAGVLRVGVLTAARAE